MLKQLTSFYYFYETDVINNTDDDAVFDTDTYKNIASID
jgi:hypothetical protein